MEIILVVKFINKKYLRENSLRFFVTEQIAWNNDHSTAAQYERSLATID